MNPDARLAPADLGIIWVALVVAVVASGCSADSGRDISPSAPQTSSPTPSETPSPSRGVTSIDTVSWTTYTSKRYDMRVGHPEDWTVQPASRGWKAEDDIDDSASKAHESFLAPDGDVRVSAWFMPLDRDNEIESSTDLVAWAEDSCRDSGNTPCTGIAERGIELCLEKWDCHPDLLVPFKSDVQAFFSAGIYDSAAMTVVSVWRPETHPSVAQYGGAQRLLEGFLSTMQVWPATTPRDERR